MAAAIALADTAEVSLFEARGGLAGRAASFHDPASGAPIDFCQHVSMGCCTNLADFLQRCRLEQEFELHRRLTFITPAGKAFPFCDSDLLPAPLHLAPALAGMRWLTLAERWRLAGGLLRLAREEVTPPEAETDVLAWLRRNGQPPRVIETFWEAVLVSALGETLDRAGTAAARRVIVGGFLRNRRAWRLLIPRRPLAELFGELAAAVLAERGVALHTTTPVRRLLGSREAVTALETHDGRRLPFDQFLLAVPWRQASALSSASGMEFAELLRGAEQLVGSPISGIHLWFSRPLTSLPHAVLLGGLSQWLFVPPRAAPEANAERPPAEGGWYCQVVVSASRGLGELSKEAVLEQVVGELRSYFPAAAEARLLRGKIVTEREAVFSSSPGSERLRPPQGTPIPNLALAGDWTNTGWPATMEGAVRSGYLAAEVLAAAAGAPRRFARPELPLARLSRWLLGKAGDSPGAG